MRLPTRQAPEPIVLTDEQQALLEQTELRTRELAETLNAAIEAEIPQSVLLPRLVEVARETGLLPKGLRIPGLG